MKKIKSTLSFYLIIFWGIWQINGCTVSSQENKENLPAYNTIFVSVNGNDNNSGFSPSAPLRTIGKAIQKITEKEMNIYITTGVYVAGNGLSSLENGILLTNKSNIRFIGGWNSDFSEIVGYTELDGLNSLYHVFFIRNASNVVISNFIIRNGNASESPPHDKGGGIYLSNVCYSFIGNIILSNNNAHDCGGGLYLRNSHNNVIDVIAKYNVAYFGGGLSVNYSTNNTVSGILENNKATNGGGMLLYYATNNIIGGNFSNNNAIYGGGGILLDSSIQNRIIAYVKNNNSVRGAGIYIVFSENNTIEGSILENKALSDIGGGILLWYSTNNILSGSVCENEASAGGGVCSWYSANNIISGNIIGNRAGSAGGVYLFAGENNKIMNGILTNNWGIDLNNVIGLKSETNLLISNCVVGGNGTSIGIYEYNDITGHIFKDNKFVSSQLEYFYHDFVMGDTNNSDALNETSYSGASEASGNSVLP